MSVLVGGFRINMHSKHIEFNVHCIWNGSGKKCLGRKFIWDGIHVKL